jgi:hypothetical protein
MEQPFRFSAIAALILLSLPLPVLAGMYKWYDDQGKVNYTQTPPPKGARMAPINTDTFNTVKMSDVSKLSLRSKPKPTSQTKKKVIHKTAPKRTRRRSCPLRRSR